MIDVFPLFASPLAEIRVEENLDYIMEYANKEEFALGYQSANNGSLCSKNRRIVEEYSDIKTLLKDYFYKFSQEFLRYDGEFEITTSWFSKVERGGCQFHFHKNSFYSGVLYFGEYDNKNGGEIQFNNQLAQFTDYTIIPRDYYIGNCNEYNVYPTKNLLLLFPSYLSHRIGDYKGKTPRYSLAFNVVPIGEYGQSDSTYNTEWI